MEIRLIQPTDIGTYGISARMIEIEQAEFTDQNRDLTVADLRIPTIERTSDTTVTPPSSNHRYNWNCSRGIEREMKETGN
jgi:hypothetical protein